MRVIIKLTIFLHVKFLRNAPKYNIFQPKTYIKQLENDNFNMGFFALIQYIAYMTQSRETLHTLVHI